ncbi:ATP-binding protein [Larkinella terrae]|uniref:histidine kinase n=1 Tax=Larkinella terrae TaxID=2025311 RepID=A0A7K0EIX0_9BACT|nr:ATP-binding protein [Larkinella terrae]MRS61406.1 response regulator [Larkinella terrae]
MLIFTISQRRLLTLLLTFCWSTQAYVLLAQKNQPAVVEKGVIDLSSYSYQSAEPVMLTGKWFFKWNQFVDSNALIKSQNYISVPGDWHSYTGSSILFPQDLGHCTYGVRIILPESGKIWSLRIPAIRTAYKLYVNGQLVTQTGQLATDRSAKPGTDSKVVSFAVPGKEAFVLVQVANYHFAYGGIWKTLQFGNPTTILLSQERTLLLSAFMIGALLITGVYHFVLYALRRKDRAPLLFGILCLTAGFRELFNSGSLFFLIFPDANWFVASKALYCAFPVGIVGITLYLEYLFPDLFSKVVRKSILALNIAFFALVLLTPATVYSAWGTLISPLAILECGYFFWISFRANQLKKHGGFILFCDMILLTLCVINDTLYQAGVIHTYYLLSVAVMVFTLCQSLLLAIRFSMAFTRSEALTVELQTANNAIEQMAIRRQEAERRKLVEEVKNRFFANITHEFRTPLTLIITPIEQLLQTAGNETKTDSSVLRNTMVTIHRNARQLLQLINQLLDLSKLEAGSLKVRESQGDVATFIGDLVDSFRITAETKGVELTYQSERVPEQLAFDDDKWGKISYNLISNALKYTAAGGSVKVKLEASPLPAEGQLTLRLSVSDTGTGIPQEHIPHIFDRFYQVDDSRTRSFGGTGIGLALVKELTDLLKGKIRVESELGKGTNVIVECPVRQSYTAFPLLHSDALQLVCPEVTTPPAELLVERKLASQEPLPVILVVEDNDNLRQLIASGLSDLYRVITAANGQEGWEICQAELPDLVLSDLMMPVMDGFQLCRLIKQTTQTNHIAVILLTAKTAAESKLEGLSVGANDYLTKPFDHRELQLRVSNLLHYQSMLRKFYNLQFNKPETSPLPAYENAFLEQLYQALEKNIDDATLSVDDLAVAVAMSSRTLNRKLSTTLGMTVSEFIRNYRLRKAADLLKAGYPVSETAYRVGFESPSYFGQCFKELFTLSPSEYVRNVLSEN